MTVRAIYCEGRSFSIPLMEKLERDHKWQTCYWAARAIWEPEFHRKFPRAIFHYNIEATRGKLPAWNPPLRPPALGEELLRKLAYHQAIALKMMDRMDPGEAFSHEERVRLYLRLVGNALAILEATRPDVLVCPTSPHMVHDYVLYALCKQFGVRTFMFERTYFPRLILLVEDLDRGPTGAAVRYRELVEDSSSPPASFPAHIEERMAKARRRYDKAMPHTVQQRLDRIGRYGPQGGKEWLRYLGAMLVHPGRVLTAARDLKRFIADPAPEDYTKVRGRMVEHSYLSGLAYRQGKQRSIKRMRALEAQYRSLSEPVDFNAPYIYVALQAQPEKSTSPDAGLFVYQQLMVDLLAKSLPPGWRIYVKDHLVQFNPSIKGDRGRWRFHYSDLLAIPGVRLASMETSPFDLIDHAQAVATTTGSTGWEAILRGKPALLFGPAWYQGCEGGFPVRNSQEAKAALERIQNGYQIDHEKVSLYIKALQEAGVEAWNDPRWEKNSGLTMEQNVEALCRALVGGLAKYDGTGQASPRDGDSEASGDLSSPSVNGIS